ncbi:MAG: tetratricopeptide repeat protein [Leptospiraceae bacterium]|nr:tetratricopeptide repeat protein [Leptospiraceae bacterium]MCP5511153.1 tetratricopeptide repeat protein [Leptospiraceae bacterium]
MKFILFFLVTSLSFSLIADPLLDSYKHEKEGNYIKAFEAIEPILGSSGKDYVIQLRAGWLLYMIGNFSQAVMYFQKASVLNATSLEPRIYQLKPLMSLGKFREVELVAKSILRLDSKNYTARSSLAFSLYSAGDFKNAKIYYESLIQDYPTDTEMIIGLAYSHLNQVEKSKALEYFRMAERLIPWDSRVKLGIEACEAK